MKLINTTPIEQLGGFKYSCECGAHHAATTADIIFREGALNELPSICEKLAGTGTRIFLLCAEGSGLENKILPQLKMFRPDLKVLPELIDISMLTEYINCPDDVRLIIAAGGGALIDAAKFIATAARRSLVVIPDKIRCDAVLSPAAAVYNSGFKELYKAHAPDAAIIDYDIVLDMNENDIASAFGTIMGKLISLFDWKIANIIGNEKKCEIITDLVCALIDECFEGAERLRRRERPALIKIIELNLRAGLYMQLAASSRISCGAETQVEHTLEMLFNHEERDLRGYGENIMLCAAFIAKMYRLALSRDFGGFSLPPDNNMRAECAARFLGVDASRALTKARPILSIETLKSRRYKLREYRDELFEDICVIEKKVLLAYKLFKRIYSDAGYSLTEYIDPADFKVVMPLAPDIRDKLTLLSVLKDVGLLDTYLVD